MESNHRIQAVVFDVGGVILRTEDRAPRSALAKRYGMTYEEIDRFVFGSSSAKLASIGQITEEEHWRSIGEKLGLDTAGLGEFRREFWAGDQVDEELMAFIRSLRPRVTTGLLSNAWDGARVTMRDRFKILDAFDVMIFSAEARLAKPDAAIYHLILEELKLPAVAVAFVDDFIENVEAARALGLAGVHFKSSAQARADITALLNP